MVDMRILGLPGDQVLLRIYLGGFNPPRGGTTSRSRATSCAAQPALNPSTFAPAFFFQFHQGIQVLTELLLLGLPVDFIWSALSVSDLFSLLSFGTHLHLHGGKK